VSAAFSCRCFIVAETQDMNLRGSDNSLGNGFWPPAVREITVARPGVLISMNFKAFKYGYYANDSLDRQEIPTQGRYQRWLISFQTYGLAARNPRANISMIYGLPVD
jgi:hypothetical protein